LPEQFLQRSYPVEERDISELEKEARWIYQQAFVTRTISKQVGHFVNYLLTGAYKAVKEHETYSACQVPSQPELFANWFQTKISLFEAIYGITHDETSRGSNIPKLSHSLPCSLSRKPKRVSELLPNFECLDNEGTPRRYRRSTGR